MRSPLTPQFVIMQDFQAFRPNIRGSTIAPAWEQNQIRPTAISRDPHRIYCSSYEMVYCAELIQQGNTESARVLNPPLEPLKPCVVIDHCRRSENETEASSLALSEKWMPQSSYHQVALGQALTLLLKGTLEEPEFMQVTTMREGIQTSLQQREWVHFSMGRTNHTVNYQVILRDPQQVEKLFLPESGTAAEGLGAFVNAALSVASRLYAVDPDFFSGGFGITGPRHHYLFNFLQSNQQPDVTTFELCDYMGYSVPIAADSFPRGAWRLYNRDKGNKVLSVSLYWDPHEFRLEIERPLGMKSPGIRALENYLANAHNTIKDEQTQLTGLESAALNDALIDQIAGQLIASLPAHEESMGN